MFKQAMKYYQGLEGKISLITAVYKLGSENSGQRKRRMASLNYHGPVTCSDKFMTKSLTLMYIWKPLIEDFCIQVIQGFAAR